MRGWKVESVLKVKLREGGEVEHESLDYGEGEVLIDPPQTQCLVKGRRVRSQRASMERCE